MMKVLLCNTRDSSGGAAIAARRLHHALLQQGTNSLFLAARKDTDMPFVLCANKSKWAKLKNLIIPHLDRLHSYIYSPPNTAGYCTFSWFPSRADKIINALPHDITHLHWVNDFVSLYAMRRIRGPIVWTLHDTWAFTGGCHYPQNCTRYLQECGYCPQLASKHTYDMSFMNYCLKKKAIKKSSLTIITPSTAFKHMAQKSSLLRDIRVEHIPNCIDIAIYRPIDRLVARRLLGLPETTPLILFGVLNPTTDYRKGYDLLLASLQILAESTRMKPMCLVFGASQGETNQVPFPTKFLGQLHDDLTLALAYASADVFVCPSREENLPNTILEALACATPAVAFACGGIPDLISSGINGYLATPHEPQDLARGIALILENAELQKNMSHAARSIVEERFAMPVIAQQHQKLYADILNYRK